MKNDEYKTIKKMSQGSYKEKGSRFLSFAYPVSNEEEIKGIMARLKKEYFDARHFCFAWRLGTDKKRYRANDAGEPAHSAGAPVLGQIQSFDLTDILIIVIRYFGGTKLGIPGLIMAYRSAAASALNNADIYIATINNNYKISFDYPVLNNVMKIIKEENIKVSGQIFDLHCSMTISIRQNHTQRIIEKLKAIQAVKITYLK